MRLRIFGTYQSFRERAARIKSSGPGRMKDYTPNDSFSDVKILIIILGLRPHRASDTPVSALLAMLETATLFATPVFPS